MVLKGFCSTDERYKNKMFSHWYQVKKVFCFRRTDVVESPDVRGFSLDEMTILPDLCMYVCTQM